MARKFEDNLSIAETTKTKVAFAGYDDGFIRRYNARHKEGSSCWFGSGFGSTSLVTWTGADKVERLIAEEAYSSKATAASLAGYRWEFCLEGVDEHDQCIAQTWGSSLLEADPINWDAYEAVEPDPEEQLLALWDEFKASRAAQETQEEETPE